MRVGLSEKTAVGRAGQYRAGLTTETLLLTTCVARGHEFFTHGDPMSPLLAVELPLSCRRTHHSSSWTGRCFRYDWSAADAAGWQDSRGLNLHLNWTLPGPLFTDFGRTLRLRFAFGNAPAFVNDLEKGGRYFDFVHTNMGRMLYLEGGRRPGLLVCSQPIAKLEIVSHEHLTLTFRRPAQVLWTPLIDTTDVPRTPARRRPWLDLIAAPPLYCHEAYDIRGDRLSFEQRFTAPRGSSAPRPRVAPLPPLNVLLGADGRLQTLPRHQVLCKGLLGPYALARGAKTRFSVDLAWTRAAVLQAKPVGGKLQPIPTELAYAGDVSWIPGTPMDQLISLRVWAPLAGIMPAAMWRKLRTQLMPPTAAELRQSLAYLTEPGCGRRWAKDAKLFDERGDVSYDSDWYNGFTLSGLQRAVVCPDEAISARATALMRGARRERALLQDYLSIFHDWALSCSWTDPRGETWNLDCSHNGLEGLLAESRMRSLEGDAAGAEESLYLIGKMSVALLAAYALADWCRAVGFVHHDDCAPAGERAGSGLGSMAPNLNPGDLPRGFDGPHLGLNDLREYRGAVINGPATKNPYALAGNFPEWNYLLRRHGPLNRLQQVARVWSKKYARRYRDWSFFYIGKRVGKGVASLHQEERIQAAVMYHLAPDVALRLWTLRQPGAAVEKLFRTPLNLAEQLWCRSGATIDLPPRQQR